jgi:hypothetical protein
VINDRVLDTSDDPNNPKDPDDVGVLSLAVKAIDGFSKMLQRKSLIRLLLGLEDDDDDGIPRIEVVSDRMEVVVVSMVG